MDETYSVEKLWSMITARDATILEMDGMIKELAEFSAAHFEDHSMCLPDWMENIYAAPTDVPVKLHEVIKAALSFRKADNLEEEDASDPNLS